MLYFSSKPALLSMETKLDLAGIMTTTELSNYLKVTERTTYRLVAAKKVPAFKVGGSWCFARPEIDQWIKSQSTMPMDQTDA
jgi:excisionase family DNA binding protein